MLPLLRLHCRRLDSQCRMVNSCYKGSGVQWRRLGTSAWWGMPRGVGRLSRIQTVQEDETGIHQIILYILIKKKVLVRMQQMKLVYFKIVTGARRKENSFVCVYFFCLDYCFKVMCLILSMSFS